MTGDIKKIQKERQEVMRELHQLRKKHMTLPQYEFMAICSAIDLITQHYIATELNERVRVLEMNQEVLNDQT